MMRLRPLQKTHQSDLLEKAFNVDSFGRGIRSAVRGLWSGQLDYFGFADTMISTIRRGLTMAWNEGASQCGMRPGDMTDEEKSILENEIMAQFQYIPGFANDIMASSKGNQKKLTPLLGRSEMWVNRYQAVSSMAMTYACRDSKLKWVMHPNKEHCGSCLRLNGRVYRSSIWKKYGIFPRIRALACGGWRCGCTFEPTTDPVTPGRPPQIP